MRFRSLTTAVAVTCVAVLAAGVADVASKHAAPTPAGTWDPRVLPIVRFVEAHRGLHFTRPVPVSFLSDHEFDKQVAVPAPESKKDKADLARLLSTLRALGLVHGTVDLNGQLDTLLKSNVIGLYVPKKKAVFVRGTELGPYARVTLAHELTHALQDQHFDIKKMQDSAPGGDTTAVTALIEGDAVRIQDQYQKALPSGDKAEFDRVERITATRSKGASSVPAVLKDFLGFPYTFGPVLLDTLTAKDGNAAVDRAFRNPPSAEAQIVDPVGHPITEKPTPVPTPQLPAGAKKLDHVSPFGQVSLFEVLGSWLGYRSAWDAVADWRGDTSVPYSAHGLTCVAVDVAMGSSTSTTLLATTFQRWVPHVPGATVTVSKGLVAVRSCDPGEHGRALPKLTASAFDVLSARAAIIHEVMSGGGPYRFGQCVADGLIAALTPSGYADLAARDLPPARLAALQGLARQAAQHCRLG
jgi:hypothetical protein